MLGLKRFNWTSFRFLRCSFHSSKRLLAFLSGYLAHWILFVGGHYSARPAPVLLGVCTFVKPRILVISISIYIEKPCHFIQGLFSEWTQIHYFLENWPIDKLLSLLQMGQETNQRWVCWDRVSANINDCVMTQGVRVIDEKYCSCLSASNNRVLSCCLTQLHHEFWVALMLSNFGLHETRWRNSHSVWWINLTLTYPLTAKKLWIRS